MSSEVHRQAPDQEANEAAKTEDKAVERVGVIGFMVRGLFWPFRATARGFWWLLGYREKQVLSTTVTSPARQSRSGRRSLHRVTRILLWVLPRWAQRALGYPVSSTIGRTLSPEVRVSPTKPCGKGSKRKQDELDEEEEEDHQTWVEALNQELADEPVEEDPDYEPSTVETDSEEYHSHNNTESDIEIQSKGVIVIEDVCADTEQPTPTPTDIACPY